MVDFSPHIRRGHPAFMAALLVFAIIEGCITAYLVAQFNDDNSYPSHSYRDRLKFLVFTSWWTVVFAAAYMAAFLAAASNFVSSIASHLAVWTVTWIFWLAAAASYTAALGGGMRCSVSDVAHCSSLVAAEAFAWIEWIIMTIFFIFLLTIAGAALRRGDRLSAELAV
ncbi:hypothetical protein J008_02965 [Cryptococcus neoformans]|uniref:MARVEL domain-containing protein n=2 Tax=Cryptococcus neoformans TaxID=5207 RepID=A0A854QCG6_CRYNE|nr:hypothetical protein CNAG_01043 [Cryptococcus neoformans var. grubii H99]AUB24853.1 hypothetical protein CKF44_01043 [Cryptococcus neoformans var. grubii]OWT40093.1 hypothetical protein C362_02591 [Cryptococcus neoformans var. grubii Bt1]OWZ32558.1 hypothetical protein C347_03257 [Cryptococcus neoformans var. grubii AD2-60a]OWZ43983.1 hypothetical protein C353_03098 [Cryptococcus neoformans var. grubii AD1-83a]OWZ44405.1 hypothetical protein C343_03194 [Cryptococcus neoformans var. grubii C|eukprot:XP_012049279.1 hypothetical protein CNAG_01043 [Cryptococcus neoformans var. grubii H99]